MKKLLLILLLLTGYTVGNSQALSAWAMPFHWLVPDSLPGPIQQLTVTIRDNSKGLLRWRTDSILAESFFSVEKSTNGIDYNVIGVTKNKGTGWYEFLDDSPLKGKLFYRIRLSSGLTDTYSQAVTTILSADVSCKFYPNPVDKALIVRNEFPLELQIADRFGKPLIAEHLQAGLKVIDVSALEPGPYIITLYQKDGNRLITETLLKK